MTPWRDRTAVLVGSFGMSGFFPVAPATFASAVVTPLWGLAYAAWPSPAVQALLCVAVLLVGVWSSGRLEHLYGKDPSAAVIDEVLGMGIVLAGVPISPVTLMIGFLLFRVLDVVKLPPGRALERLPGGWGIMLDDACAGLYGALALQAILWAWPEPRLAAWHWAALGGAVVALWIARKPLLRRYGKKRCDPRTGFAGSE